MGRRARKVRAAAADGRVTDLAKRATAYTLGVRRRCARGPAKAGGPVLATGRGTKEEKKGNCPVNGIWEARRATAESA